jgi:hypothetical protein
MTRGRRSESCGKACASPDNDALKFNDARVYESAVPAAGSFSHCAIEGGLTAGRVDATSLSMRILERLNFAACKLFHYKSNCAIMQKVDWGIYLYPHKTLVFLLSLFCTHNHG